MCLTYALPLQLARAPLMTNRIEWTSDVSRCMEWLSSPPCRIGSGCRNMGPCCPAATGASLILGGIRPAYTSGPHDDSTLSAFHRRETLVNSFVEPDAKLNISCADNNSVFVNCHFSGETTIKIGKGWVIFNVTFEDFGYDWSYLDNVCLFGTSASVQDSVKPYMAYIPKGKARHILYLCPMAVNSISLTILQAMVGHN